VKEPPAYSSENRPLTSGSGISAALSSLSETTRSKAEAEKRVRLDAIREQLQRLAESNAEIAAFIDANISDFNGRPSDAASLRALEHLLSEQHFRLAYWQDPNEGINYRRFFAIADLVGVRAEVTGWSSCTRASERVYITGEGCESEFGGTREL
jgi:maltooligosyltrehalose synthase